MGHAAYTHVDVHVAGYAGKVARRLQRQLNYIRCAITRIQI